MALGSQGSWLEQRFLEPDALTIYVLSSLDVIDCIDDKVEIGPEVVIEDVFVLRTDSGLERFEFNVFIHCVSDHAGSWTFIFADVFSSEQELSVQIADLDIVIVSNCHFASFRGETHKSEHLDEFTAKSSCTDHEWAWLSEVFNELVSENDPVVEVTVRSQGSGHISFGKGFKEIVMKPLSEGGELSC